MTPAKETPRDIGPEHAPPEPEPVADRRTLTEMLRELQSKPETADEAQEQDEQLGKVKLVFKRWITSVDLSSALSEEKARQLLVILVDEPGNEPNAYAEVQNRREP